MKKKQELFEKLRLSKKSIRKIKGGNNANNLPSMGRFSTVTTDIELF